MPDTGDEVARDMANAIAQLLMGQLNKATGAYKNRHTLSKGIKNHKAKGAKTHTTPRASVRPATPAAEEGPLWLDIYATNPEELSEMCAVFDQAHIEYAFDLDAVSSGQADLSLGEVRPNQVGLYCIWVADRTPEEAVEGYVRFDDAPEAIKEIVFANGAEDALVRQRFYSALESLEGKGKFSVDEFLQNGLSFDFKTPRWDRAADTLKKAFDAAGISYTVANLSNDTVRFDVPAEYAKDAVFEISDLIAERQGVAASNFRLRQNNTDQLKESEELADEIAEHEAAEKALDELKGQWEFPAESKIEGDLTFNFTTTSWDRDASLLKKAFDSAEVKYSFTKYSDMVKFEVPATHSKKAAVVISDLIATVKGMDAKRFELQGYKASDLRKDVVLTPTVQGEEEYVKMCEVLDATEVAYEASFDEEANLGKFTFSASDLVVHGVKLPTTAAEVRELLKQREASDAKPSQTKKIDTSAFDLKDTPSSEISQRTATPARDAQRATRTAELLNKQTPTQEHVLRQSRGR